MPKRKPKSRHVAIVIFLDKDKNIVLQLRGTHAKIGEKYGFFGGSIEDGETKEQAMIRELKEELNFKPEKIVFYRSNSWVIHTEGIYKDWTIYEEIFISPITPLLLRAKVEEGAGMELMNLEKLDTIVGLSSENLEKLNDIKQNFDGLINQIV